MKRHFGQKLSSFITGGRNFHVKRSRFLCWTVEIFMLNGWDFHDKQSRFSWWTVKIFILNGRHFRDKQSRFSCWTAEIFMLNGRDFHNKRSRFSRWHIQDCLLPRLKSRSTKGASSHPAFLGNCPTIIHTCKLYGHTC